MWGGMVGVEGASGQQVCAAGDKIKLEEERMA